MKKTAVISPDGKYRYLLTRDWSEDDDPFQFGNVNFVMLNPSTADASADDPTIRKCVGFAKHNGFSSLSVLNLFAYRATNPKELLTAWTRNGPDNDRWLSEIPRDEPVVAAWGSGFPYNYDFGRSRIPEVKDILNRELWCVKISGGTRPWHPLYVPYGKFIKLSE